MALCEGHAGVTLIEPPSNKNTKAGGVESEWQGQHRARLHNNQRAPAGAGHTHLEHAAVIMATTLSQQLSELQQRQSVPPQAKFKGRPSLLFDFRKAADVDLDTLYEIGCQGVLLWWRPRRGL